MRRTLVGAALTALVLATAGCHGPMSTNAVTIQTDCTSWVTPGAPGTDVTADLQLSVASSSWATAGARVTFTDLTIAGVPAPNPEWITFASVTGIGPFPDQPSLPTVLAALQPPGSVVLGESPDAHFNPGAAHLAGAIGTTATVDLASVVAFGSVADHQYVITCTPLAGQSTRLASIAVVDGGGH